MSTYKLSFKSPAEIIKFIEEQDVQYIDFNFTDLRGKWHHTTQHVSRFNKSLITQGVGFDASLIAGGYGFVNSDMLLRPDLTRVTYDPFAAQKTIKIFCDVHDPATKLAYAFDPRSIAKNAQNYLKKTGHADTAYFGAKPEFFVFDHVTVNTEAHHVAYQVDSVEGAYNSGREYPTGNMGHRPAPGGGDLSESPIDSLSDIRAEMLSVIENMGVSVEKHSHGVAAGQCELGMMFSTLLEAADNVQLYKYGVHNVAHSYGKTATFMPKPVNGESGSGMHVHQSLWKSGKPIFSGDGYANLSENALYYIGGILKHAHALQAFMNPATNSYKRLASGFGAPLCLTYSAGNRSAACRIPYAPDAQSRRIDVRLPDSMANPYLAFSAMLMAGLDGIENKIHPGEAVDEDMYNLSAVQRAVFPDVCSSLRKALEALGGDHAFLLKGGVFTEGVIERYIKLKSEDVARYEAVTHPVEFSMYYSG